MLMSQATASPNDRVFSVATKCATPEEFVSLFQRFIDHEDESLFVVSREPREIGSRHAFQIKLKDGTIILKGNARILRIYGPGQGPGGKQGVAVKLTRLDEASAAIYRELLGEEFKADPTGVGRNPTDPGATRRRTVPPAPGGRTRTAPPIDPQRGTVPPAGRRVSAPPSARASELMRRSATRPPRDPVAIHGTLEQFGLTSMLTFLEMEKKTGVLIVTNDDGATGRVFLRQGIIVRARLDGTRNPINDAAVSALLSWDEGRFEFISLDVEAD
jgi:hypothetical protein